jgi:hypothetical protein
VTFHYVIYIIAFFTSESVQRSLENKFGKNADAIPIVPSENFAERIAVSE